MFAVLALVFLIVPFLELFVLLQIGQTIGALPTVALLIVVSVIGGWLVKREGIAVFRRAQQQLHNGQVPSTELIDGVLILFAGALLISPGFLTDVVGVVLLLPPVRVALRGLAANRLAKRAALRLERW